MTGDAPFHQTRMGQAFYELTMPALVRQLARLADVLDRLAEQSSGGRGDDSAPAGSKSRNPGPSRRG